MQLNEREREIEGKSQGKKMKWSRKVKPSVPGPVTKNHCSKN